MRTAIFTLLIAALFVDASRTSEAWKNKKTSELTDQQRARLAKKKEYIRAAVGVGKPVEDKVEEKKVEEKVVIKDAPTVPIPATPVNFTGVSVAPVPIRNLTASPLPLPADLVKLNEKKNSAQSLTATGALGLLALLFLN